MWPRRSDVVINMVHRQPENRDHQAPELTVPEVDGNVGYARMKADWFINVVTGERYGVEQLLGRPLSSLFGSRSR